MGLLRNVPRSRVGKALSLVPRVRIVGSSPTMDALHNNPGGNPTCLHLIGGCHGDEEGLEGMRRI